MNSARYGSAAWVLAAVFLLVWAVAAGVAAAGGPTTDRAQAPRPAAAPPQAGAYAGEATCLTCHEDRKYAGTAHALTFNARTPAATHGCESCHGAGKAHADSGGEPDKIVNP